MGGEARYALGIAGATNRPTAATFPTTSRSYLAIHRDFALQCAAPGLRDCPFPNLNPNFRRSS